MWVFSSFFTPLRQYKYLWVVDKTRHLSTSSRCLGNTDWNTGITITVIFLSFLSPHDVSHLGRFRWCRNGAPRWLCASTLCDLPPNRGWQELIEFINTDTCTEAGRVKCVFVWSQTWSSSRLNSQYSLRVPFPLVSIPQPLIMIVPDRNIQNDVINTDQLLFCSGQFLIVVWVCVCVCVTWAQIGHSCRIVQVVWIVCGDTDLYWAWPLIH